VYNYLTNVTFSILGQKTMTQYSFLTLTGDFATLGVLVPAYVPRFDETGRMVQHRDAVDDSCENETTTRAATDKNWSKTIRHTLSSPITSGSRKWKMFRKSKSKEDL
jgi:hypothetical protein